MRSNVGLTILAGLVIGASSSNAAAQQVLKVPADYTTIQSAIDAASSGDTILVAPGEYPGSFEIMDKSLAIIAQEGADTTVLEGSEQGLPTLTIDHEEEAPLVLQGFTLRNGVGVNGGGAFVAGRTQFVSCVFETNFARRGAGIFAAAEVRLENVRFVGNLADLGGGVFVGPTGSLTAVNSLFESNEASYGGGVYTTPNAVGPIGVRLDHVEFRSNVVFFDGGAAAIFDRDAVIQSVVAENNHAGGLGGALLVELSSDVTISNSEFYGNTADGRGGAIVARGDSTVDGAEVTACRNVPQNFDGVVEIDGLVSFCSNLGGPCLADFSSEGVCDPTTKDEVVSLTDFTCFLTYWQAGDAAADISLDADCSTTSGGGDGVTLTDFSCFLSMWASGCA